MAQQLTEKELAKNIQAVLEELTGEEVVEVYNHICSKKIRYVGDNIWEETGEED